MLPLVEVSSLARTVSLLLWCPSWMLKEPHTSSLGRMGRGTLPIRSARDIFERGPSSPALIAVDSHEIAFLTGSVVSNKPSGVGPADVFDEVTLTKVLLLVKIFV